MDCQNEMLSRANENVAMSEYYMISLVAYEYP